MALINRYAVEVKDNDEGYDAYICADCIYSPFGVGIKEGVIELLELCSDKVEDVYWIETIEGWRAADRECEGCGRNVEEIDESEVELS